jgi:hypothetical protein
MSSRDLEKKVIIVGFFLLVAGTIVLVSGGIEMAKYWDSPKTEWCADEYDTEVYPCSHAADRGISVFSAGTTMVLVSVIILIVISLPRDERGGNQE